MENEPQVVEDNTVLDELDLKILSMLSTDARISYREIASNLGVAPGTIYNRINKMTEQRVIKGYIPLIDYEKLGYGSTALIFIQVEGQHLEQVEQEIATIAEVRAVYDITGEFDVVVIARFQNIPAMNAFIKKTLRNPYIKRTVTNVVLNIVKEDPRIQL
ncbi:MAG: Lrp/AsnC family transcriptional regulator [Candidatus Bathyarchaeota archaeon]|nr:MAG: Lrp/AsnC family transcriptional regulator [Candidatus Bathyarchaeota archaeon]